MRGVAPAEGGEVERPAVDPPAPPPSRTARGAPATSDPAAPWLPSKRAGPCRPAQRLGRGGVARRLLPHPAAGCPPG